MMNLYFSGKNLSLEFKCEHSYYMIVPFHGTACPDITMRELSEDWEFIVLACDGIWDVMTNQVRLP